MRPRGGGLAHRPAKPPKKAPEVLNNIGIAYEELGDYENSIIHYKKAISQKQNYAEAYNNLGNVHLYQDALDEAINAYKKAILLKPNLSLIHI